MAGRFAVHFTIFIQLKLSSYYPRSLLKMQREYSRSVLNAFNRLKVQNLLVSYRNLYIQNNNGVSLLLSSLFLDVLFHDSTSVLIMFALFFPLCLCFSSFVLNDLTFESYFLSVPSLVCPMISPFVLSALMAFLLSFCRYFYLLNKTGYKFFLYRIEN